MSGRVIRINFTMTPKQCEVDASPARFKLWKAGRRGAKTWYVAYWLTKNAIRSKGKHWYVTKTLGLAFEELWPVLLDIVPREFVRKVDERRLIIYLRVRGVDSCIALKSAEKLDNLRGRGLASVVVDEAAFLPGMVWEVILRPQLAGSAGPALICSSPKKGWFTQLYHKIKAEPDPEFEAFHSTIYDNPHMLVVRLGSCKTDGQHCDSCRQPLNGTHERLCPLSEIAAIKGKAPVNTWMQEYMAEEVSDQGQVYDEFSNRNIYDPRKDFLDAKTFTTIRGLDWGTDAEAGAVWVGIAPDGRLVISEEHAQKGWDPTRQAEAILTKSAGFGPITTNVLDRSAFRMESSLTSVADQYRLAGIPCQRSERDVQGSVGIVKRFLRGGETPWLMVSAKCHKIIEAFQTWEHGDHEPDIAAAGRYGITWAVVKKLTKLSDAIPAVAQSSAAAAVTQREADFILASQARIVPVRRKPSWRFDRVNGVPF